MGKLFRYKNCIVCGWENPIGFDIDFVEGNGYVYGRVVPGDKFEGYNGIIHGGIISTLLDEVMVKALFSMDIVSVTMEITVKFRKSVSIEQELLIKGYPGEIKDKIAFARAEAILPDKTIAADAEGKFYILKGEQKKKMIDELL